MGAVQLSSVNTAPCTWRRLSGFGFWVSGFGVQGSGFGFRVSGLGFSVEGSGCRV